jgi:hypothetical protein
MTRRYVLSSPTARAISNSWNQAALVQCRAMTVGNVVVKLYKVSG